MNRLLIAGTNSGCGKTTVTCAILAALKARNLMPTAFKCGPDYIDPMFHRTASGVAAYNIDPFFLDGNGLRSHLAFHAGELAVIEGAMGYYDGIGTTSEASAYTVARETQTPVALVVNARSAAGSLGAIIEGFARFRPDSRIEGILFNEASEGRYEGLKRIAEAAGVRAYGYMPPSESWSLPSRSLGLLPAEEIDGIRALMEVWGRQAEQSIDIDGLIGLARTVSPLPTSLALQSPHHSADSISDFKWTQPVRLAVARDEAFCFFYEENLEMLRSLGCELIFFSPLHGKELPLGTQGLYLCGGYPELYADKLSGNESMRQSIRRAVDDGLPTFAEGGGFLYLHESLGGKTMCGVIRANAFDTGRLVRFGYTALTANRDSLLCMKGTQIRAQEFHSCDSASNGDGFTAMKAGRDLSYPCIHATDTLHAGFPQLYFPSNPALAKRFVEKMGQRRVNQDCFE